MSGNTETYSGQISLGKNSTPSAIAAWIAGIPQSRLVYLGKILGLLIYILDRPHRKIVRRNLHFAYPQWSGRKITCLSRRIFQNLGITFCEICQIPFLSAEDIRQRVRVRGEKNMIKGLNSPTGAIGISAHLGNWELCSLSLSCYLNIPLVLVGRRLESKTLDRWFFKLRTRFGNTILYKKGALSEMTRTLRNGKHLGVLIDQGTNRREGVNVQFFNRTVTATFGVALLAIRCRCPVFPIFCVREADGKLTLIAMPPLKLKRTGNLRADVQENTQIMVHAIEKAIRAYPEQWFWLHKRWKRHYPHLYPEYQTKRRRKNKRKTKKSWQ